MQDLINTRKFTFFIIYLNSTTDDLLPEYYYRAKIKFFALCSISINTVLACYALSITCTCTSARLLHCIYYYALSITCTCTCTCTSALLISLTDSSCTCSIYIVHVHKQLWNIASLCPPSNYNKNPYTKCLHVFSRVSHLWKRTSSRSTCRMEGEGWEYWNVRRSSLSNRSNSSIEWAMRSSSWMISGRSWSSLTSTSCKRPRINSTYIIIIQYRRKVFLTTITAWSCWVGKGRQVAESYPGINVSRVQEGLDIVLKEVGVVCYPARHLSKIPLWLQTLNKRKSLLSQSCTHGIIPVPICLHYSKQ